MKKRLHLVPDVKAVPADPVKICNVPGCFTVLGERNTSGVCKIHMHRLPHCGCTSCVNNGARNRLRVRSREEMVKLGLLPA